MQRVKFSTHIILLTVLSIIILVMMVLTGIGAIVGMILLSKVKAPGFLYIVIILSVLMGEVILLLVRHLILSLRAEWYVLQDAFNSNAREGEEIIKRIEQMNKKNEVVKQEVEETKKELKRIDIPPEVKEEEHIEEEIVVVNDLPKIDDKVTLVNDYSDGYTTIPKGTKGTIVDILNGFGGRRYKVTIAINNEEETISIKEQDFEVQK